MLVYERAPRFRTVLTYALSALWHGFYPGYYLTFMSGALFTFASRAVSHVQPNRYHVSLNIRQGFL
jgi:Predicted membrane protein